MNKAQFEQLKDMVNNYDFEWWEQHGEMEMLSLGSGINLTVEDLDEDDLKEFASEDTA